MNEFDRSGFAEVMLGLGEAYGEPISETRMEIYFAALSDLPLAELRHAATIHVRTQKFFPRVAELREAIQGNEDDRASLAWTDLLKQVRRVGYIGTPTFDDPVAQRAAMELYGGWRSLCERLPGDGPELLGAAKLFKATYAAYARRDIRNALALPPTEAESYKALANLGDQLRKRGLPAPGLELVK